MRVQHLTHLRTVDKVRDNDNYVLCALDHVWHGCLGYCQGIIQGSKGCQMASLMIIVDSLFLILITNSHV